MSATLSIDPSQLAMMLLLFTLTWRRLKERK